ncbi:hypothetical protein RYH73_11005 [Olivibacter sp. CPCC 100613]|uniref:LpxL/LpxP family acyltransferase n=1 Tax=Olivibacter sp. CPCC 100613 TaxID=3079931 RepID=UPI002FFD3524
MKKNILALRQRIIQSYRQFDLTDATIKQERQFAVFSANLYNALPTLSPKKYLSLFKQVHINRRLSFLDIEHAVPPGILHINGWENAWVQCVKDRPGIVCTYHTGSYRLLNYLMIQAGIPISLVVSAKAYQMEEKFKQNLYRGLAKNIHLQVELINAEESHALIRMTRALRNGRSLVLYIDGNMGTKVETGVSHNLLPIKFFGLEMSVRKGLATLAFRLKCPIYPLICRRLRNTGIAYSMHRPIISTQLDEEASFVHWVTKALYKQLEDFLRQYPEQWEGWLYLQEHLVAPRQNCISPNFENWNAWSLYRSRQKGFLLHRPDYRIYPITLNDYDTLKAFFGTYL